MGKIVKSANTFGKAYYGCEEKRKDVMISVKVEDESGFKTVDLFLTTKQAEDLYDSLGKTISKNEGVVGTAPEDLRGFRPRLELPPF